jgi:hypothetical protein
MATATRTGATDSLGREAFVVSLPAVASVGPFALPSTRFACLVACDSRMVDASDLLAFGRSLIEQGAAYVCAWGPGCRELEDAVDQASVELDMERGHETPVVMTTAHPDDTLEEALEFLSKSALPDRAYAGECRASVGITVGNLEWSAQIEKWFSQLTGHEPVA